VILNHEHDAFRWLTAEEVKDITPERIHVQIDLIDEMVSPSDANQMPGHRTPARLLEK
jgi:hypothetical protein